MEQQCRHFKAHQKKPEKNFSLVAGWAKKALKVTLLTFPRKCLRYSLAVGSLSSFTLPLQEKGTSDRVGLKLERLWLVPSIQ